MRIDWRDVGDQPNVKRASDALRIASTALGGRYVANPTWSADQDHPLVTVHPLGGCPMAETADAGRRRRPRPGVLGHDRHRGARRAVRDGRVGDPAGAGREPAAHDHRPRRAGVRAARVGARVDDPVRRRRPPAPAPARAGRVDRVHRADGRVDRARRRCRCRSRTRTSRPRPRASRRGTPAEFLLTIVADGVVQFIEDPARPARAFGTVTAPVLDAQPLTVAGGEFRLFAPDDEPDVQHMTYRLPLAADDGREWFLRGIKVIDRGQLRDLWHDTTTLYVDIHEGTDELGPGRRTAACCGSRSATSRASCAR